MAQVADVDAPGRHIGGYQEAQVPALDARHRLLAGRLGEIARDLVRIEAPALQVGGHAAYVALRVAEDDGAIGIFILEDAYQVRILLLRGGDEVEVLDLLGCNLALGRRDVLGLVEEDARQRSNPLGDRRREETRLALLGYVLLDLPHIRPEAQREQLVCLVEDQDLHAVEGEATRAQVVEDAAGGSHHQVRARLDRLDLVLVADAAVDGYAAHSLVTPQDRHLLRHLVGELPGGRQHQRLAVVQLGVDRRRDGDAEGAGLAAAGVGLHDHIAPGHHQRQHLLLHGQGRFPAQIADALLDRLRQVGKYFGEITHEGRGYHAFYAGAHSGGGGSPAATPRSRPGEKSGLGLPAHGAHHT